MTSQQAIDCAVVDLVSDLGFKGPLDLGNGSYLSALGLREEGSKEFFLLLQRQILMPTTSLAWCLQCRWSAADCSSRSRDAPS
jgi:hypothetical protein